MFPPTPPFGVQQPYPPQRRPPDLGVKLLIGVGVVFAILVASGPLLGIYDFFTGWRVVDDQPTAPPVTTPPPPTPTDLPGLGAEPYRQVSAEEWAVIVRNPEAHAGRRVVVFGRLTGPPAAGSASVAAVVGPARLDDAGRYATPVLVTLVGTARTWSRYHAGDEVRLNGTIRGIRRDPGAGDGGPPPQLLELEVADEPGTFRS